MDRSTLDLIRDPELLLRVTQECLEMGHVIGQENAPCMDCMLGWTIKCMTLSHLAKAQALAEHAGLPCAPEIAKIIEEL